MKKKLQFICKKFPKDRLTRTLLLSLLLHFFFLFLPLSVFQWDLKDKDSTAKNKPLEMKFLDKNNEWVQKLLEKNKIRKNQEKENAAKRMQIVNNENTGREERPKDAQFLGEKNQTHDRQTVAPTIGTFKAAGQGTRQGSVTEDKTSGEKKKAQAKEKKKQAVAVSPQRAPGIGKGPSDISLNDLGLKMAESDFTAEAKAEKKAAPEEGLEDSGDKLGIAHGDPRRSGLSQNNDYIEDVPLGDMTNLNTVQFKYFGFYSRIRSKLEQYWGLSLKDKAEKLFRKGKTLGAQENYVTSLRIHLDQKGNVVKVMVVGTSGLKDLDDAAVESFNKAGPFPNPPSGMMVNGEAVIEWGFVVKS